MELRKMEGKKAGRIGIIVFAFCLLLFWCPRIVRADDTGTITKYAELIQMEADGYYSINPDADFGWPSGDVTVTLAGQVIDLMKDWTIPSNVTIHTPSGNGGSFGSDGNTITVAGTWNQNGASFYDTNFVVADGGKVVVNKDCVMPAAYEGNKNTMTVQAGGSLVLNDWLAVAGRLELEKGASVTAGNTKGSLQLCHGVIAGQDATVDVPVYINEGYTSGEGTAMLAGTLALNKGLTNWPGANVNITGTVTLSGLGSYGEGSKVTVQNGAKLIYTGDFGESDCVVVNAGGTLRGPESPKGMRFREGAKLVLNGTFEVPWYATVLTTKSTITGTGTIALGDEGSLINGRNGIADSIKITGRRAGEYEVESSVPSQDGTINNGDLVTVGGGKYKVLSTETKKLQYTKPVTVKAVMTIPNTVNVAGKTYKVTSIAADAFKGNQKVTTITIGNNVTSIGNRAFHGCSNLAKLTISANVASIGTKAFYGDKKLKTIVIKSTKLTASKIGSKAFQGIYGTATIKVSSSKLTAYKKLLKSRGVGSKAKIVKL